MIWEEVGEIKIKRRGTIMRRKSFTAKVLSCALATILAFNITFNVGNVDRIGSLYTVSAASEWSATAVYTGGDEVTYNGVTYRAQWWTQGETPGVASVWVAISGSTGSEGETTTQGTTAAEEPTTMEESDRTFTSVGGKRLLIGYYHTWDNSGNPFIKLRDVDSNWDVINVSFTEPVVPGSTDGKMKFNIDNVISGYSKEDFKSDIKLLQSQGKKIVLSIGGYEGYFSLESTQAVNQFVSDITGFIDEYNFDGIDIDLEQSSMQFVSGQDTDIREMKSPRQINMVKAIRSICNRYGKNFILSWAPETFYVQNGYTYYAGINGNVDARSGSYLPMINALRDVTTYVHVQLYNSAPIIGLDGTSYSMGTTEGIVAMCEMLLEGFYVNSYYYPNSKSEATWFAPLRPDQVAIGVPSSAGAAGSGQISNSGLQAAFTQLDNEYPGFRGIMTWSINWDSTQNSNSFAQENGAFLRTFSDAEVPSEEETTTQAETTTEKQTTTQAETTIVEETTTQEEVTTSSSEASNCLELQGFQISTVNEGVRTVYNVSDKMGSQEVVSSGIIYGVEGKVTEDQMYVGSTNPYVHAYTSTSNGLLPVTINGLSDCKSYAMTMKFGSKSNVALTSNYMIKLFAKLANGTYVYSDETYTYNVYRIADSLYQRGSMPSEDAHNYLYTDILKVVDPSYTEIDFDWLGSIVKPAA